MTEPSSKSSLTILRLRDGGFVVYDDPSDMGMIRMALFAASTIEETLEYVRSVLVPK